MSIASKPPRAGRAARASAFLLALSTAALVGGVLAGVDGAICLALDGSFGLGHWAAYGAALVLAVPTLAATVWVFRNALEWESGGEAG